MVLKLGLFGQETKNTWKVFKCGAGGGWKRSVGLIMSEMKKYCLESRSREISYTKYVNGRRTGHILRRNCLLQWVTEGKIQGGIEVTGRQGRRRRKLLDDF